MARQQVRRVKSLKKTHGKVAERHLEEHTTGFKQALGEAMSSMTDGAKHWSTANGHLQEIKERRLWSLKSRTLNEYAEEHLGISPGRMRQMIRHGRMLADLTGEGERLKERHAREVATLDKPQDQREAVARAEARAAAEGATEVKQRHVNAAVAEVKDDLDRDKRPDVTALERAVEQEAPLIEMQRTLKSIVKMAEAVAQSPPGRWLHMQSFAKHMDDAWAALKFARPYGMCPYCGGDRCDKCRNSGWMPRNAWTAVPKDLQKEAAHR